jgi:hypothetical protein
VVDGPNQLWLGDLTYIAIAGGFVYPPSWPTHPSRVQARIGIGRDEAVEDRRDGLIDALQDALLDGGLGERRHHGLGQRLDVGRAVEPGAAEDLPHELLAVAGDQQGAQAGKGSRPLQGRLEQRGIEPAGGPLACL